MKQPCRRPVRLAALYACLGSLAVIAAVLGLGLLLHSPQCHRSLDAVVVSGQLVWGSTVLFSSFQLLQRREWARLVLAVCSWILAFAVLTMGVWGIYAHRDSTVALILTIGFSAIIGIILYKMIGALYSEALRRYTAGR